VCVCACRKSLYDKRVHLTRFFVVLATTHTVYLLVSVVVYCFSLLCLLCYAVLCCVALIGVAPAE
jgi:hypothetical protein